MTTFEQRTAAVSKIWQDNCWLYLLMGFVLGLLALPAVQLVRENATDLLQGLVPEAVGIVFTVLIIEWFSRMRERRIKVEALEHQIICEMGSDNAALANRGVFYSWKTGMLYDGSLVGEFFERANIGESNMLVDANLYKARLNQANLKGAHLDNADLSFAHLNGVDFSNASLTQANLQNAGLVRSVLINTILEETNLSDSVIFDADLRGAVLVNANLQRAKLAKTNLQGANLVGASLLNAQLDNIYIDENTLLPDSPYPTHGANSHGSKYWTPDTDMTRYTDPNHPDFWQPWWAKNQGDE